MKKATKLILVIAISLIQLSCIKFEINPKEIVSDTVDAGKNLYDSVTRKRKGEEERKYTDFVDSPNESDDVSNNQQCKKKIAANIAASGLEISKVLSESSETLVVDGIRKIKCEMVIFIVSK